MYCSHCKTTEGSFIKTSRGIGGKQYYACRPCNTARLKEYRKTKAGAEKARIATHKSIQKYKDKQDARNILNSAIRRGEVVRPLNCSVCNTEAKCHGTTTITQNHTKLNGYAEDVTRTYTEYPSI